MESQSLSSLSSLLTTTLNHPETLETFPVDVLQESINKLSNQIIETIQVNYTSFSKMSDTVKNVDRENSIFLQTVHQWRHETREILSSLSRRIQEKELELQQMEYAYTLKQDTLKLIYIEQLLKNAPVFKSLEIQSNDKVPFYMQNSNTESKNIFEDNHFQNLQKTIQNILSTSLLLHQLQSFFLDLEHVSNYNSEDLSENYKIVYNFYLQSKQNSEKLKEQLRNNIWNHLESSLLNCYNNAKLKFTTNQLNIIPSQISEAWIWNDIQIIQTCLDSVLITNDHEWLYNQLKASGQTFQDIHSKLKDKAFQNQVSETIVNDFKILLDEILFELYLKYLPLKSCKQDKHIFLLLEFVIWPQIQIDIFPGRNTLYFKRIFDLVSNFLEEIENSFITSEEELESFRNSVLDFERKWKVQLKLCFTINKQKVTKNFDQVCETQSSEIPPTIFDKKEGELYFSVPKSLWVMLTEVCFNQDIFHLSLSDKYIELFSYLLTKTVEWCENWIQNTSKKANIQLMFIFYRDIDQLQKNIKDRLKLNLQNFLEGEPFHLIQSSIESISTEKFNIMFQKIGERCISEIVKQCCGNLKVIQTAYSVSMTTKPEKPVFGVSQLFSPLQNMLNSIDVDEEDPRIREWTQKIINSTILEYHQICIQSLETANNLYKNIQKLQKKQTENLDIATQGIKQQIRIDVEQMKTIINQWKFSESDISAFQVFESTIG